MAGKKRSRKRTADYLFDVESPMAIELRRILIRLGRHLDLDRKRTLMVTSAERSEGKSLFAFHFSLIMAYHLKKRVVLLDGDMRRPVQHSVFQESLAPGWAELLLGKATPREVVRPTKSDNLHVVPAGELAGAPSAYLGEQAVRGAVEKLHQDHDLIVLDSPPVVPVSDPLHYLPGVDGVLFVVMAGATPKDVVTRGVDILRSAGANILGVVANNLSEVLPYYYDQKYYGYDGASARARRNS
jgi:capsular exopolysaccharide synthesis family protein